MQVGKNECVIVMTHEPNWLLDWYWGGSTGRNVSHLIQEHLRGRCRLRLAGDLHHYMHHSIIPGTKGRSIEHLLVNGQGGAFLHPTHIFENFQEFQGGKYEKKAAYPTMQDSRRVCYQTCTLSFLILACDYQITLDNLNYTINTTISMILKKNEINSFRLLLF